MLLIISMINFVNPLLETTWQLVMLEINPTTNYFISELANHGRKRNAISYLVKLRA